MGAEPKRGATQHGAEQPCAERTEQSRVAERSYRDWSAESPAERPLRRHRPIIAPALYETLKHFGVSVMRAADMFGVDKKQVGKMLSGDGPTPWDVDAALPPDMAVDHVARVAGRLFDASQLIELQALLQVEITRRNRGGR